MSVQLRPGARLRSAVDTVEVVVVKAPVIPADLRCGGQPMTLAGEAAPDGLVADRRFAAGTLLGKRYADIEGVIEVLCTTAGPSSLSVGDAPLQQQGAKPLPASD